MKKSILAILLLMACPSVGLAAAVTHNATGGGQNATSTTSVSYTNLTVADGTDRAMIAICGFTVNVSGLTMVWDAAGANQSMTQVNSQVEQGNQRYVYLFALLNPATGNKTLSINWTTSGNARCGAVAFDNVLQTSIAAAFTDPHNSAANSANPSGAITTSSGDATVMGLMTSIGLSSPTQTQIMISSSGHGSATYALSTGSSDTHGWTMSSATWGLAGIRVNQVSSGGDNVGFFRRRMAVQ